MAEATIWMKRDDSASFRDQATVNVDIWEPIHENGAQVKLGLVEQGARCGGWVSNLLECHKGESKTVPKER